MELKDKVVVITGASRGLGREMAKIFAGRGARVIASARDESVLKDLASEISVDYVMVDVAKESDVVHLAGEVINKHGGIDIWINNAGVRVPRTSIEEVDVEALHNMFGVNFFGTFYGSREALKQMRKQDEGVIINVLYVCA